MFTAVNHVSVKTVNRKSEPFVIDAKRRLMIKPIAIALVALSLTACITVEVPAPEYPGTPEVVEVEGEADTPQSPKEASKPVARNAERSTPRPADTPLPAATVHPAKRRPDTDQMIVISDSGLSSRSMMEIFEANVHLAEKAFDDKWIWFVGESVERVERNRLLLDVGSSERRLYARFPSGAGLEEVLGYVALLCFDPTYTERNDIRTLTVSDCEIIENPMDMDE